MHVPGTNKEAEYLSSSRNFHFIRHSLWRLSVIELHKIVTKSSTDSYNIWAFLKNLENNNYKEHSISLDKINQWRTQLVSKKHILKKIGLLRNKVYAHTDPAKSKLEIDITFKETEEIILFIESIVKDIYSSLNIAFLTETPLFEAEGFDIIKILADEQESRIQKLIG
jgi:hypothetical protein